MRKIKMLLGLILYKIAPIKKNRYVFQSYHGHYSDSPKYIYEYIKKNNPNVESIWIIDNHYLCNLPKATQYVIKDTLKEYWITGSAKVIIDNVYCDKGFTIYNNDFKSEKLAKIISFFKNKRGQLAFTTFHGTPFKTQDRDVVNSQVKDFYCLGTEMILGNQFALDTYRHITFNKLNMHLIGCPRNDILFSDSDLIEQTKNRLGLDKKKKYILYAPTFRNDGRDTAGLNLRRSGIVQIESFDFNKLFDTLALKFGGEWVMILRFHQYVSRMVDWDNLNKTYPNRFVNGNENDEMADYLLVSDILMTDYSSSAFDFSLTKKICLIYANDLDNLIKNERGLYIPLEQLPFPFATDFDGLISIINSFNNDEYIKLIEKMHKDFGYIDDKDSTKRVSEYILKRANNS